MINRIASIVFLSVLLDGAATAAGAPLGCISGIMLYPSDAPPPVHVCAISSSDPTSSRCIHLLGGQQRFRISGLDRGSYVIVAYAVTASVGARPQWRGGYTNAVKCGLRVGCDDHTLIEVKVQAEQECTTGVDASDWTSKADVFPQEPKT